MMPTPATCQCPRHDGGCNNPFKHLVPMKLMFGETGRAGLIWVCDPCASGIVNRQQGVRANDKSEG